MPFHQASVWQYLQLGLFCLPVQVLGLLLLQGVLQLMLGLPTASLCSLQLPKQLCTPATKVISMFAFGIWHDWRLSRLQLVQ